MAHYTGKFEETHLQTPPAYQDHSQGYTQATLVDHTVGSVHTGTSMCQLAPAGMLSAHFHAFEEGFYVLAGEVLLSIDDQAYRLGSGDFGTIKVGQVHAWRNTGTEPARWYQMAAPQPKPPGKEPDTFFLKSGSAPTEASPLDLNDPRGNLLSHFGFDQIPPPGGEGRMTGALEGVFLKWMNDENMGAIHHRLFMIEYQPGVSLANHDHTFEETYYIVRGEVQATLDGERYLAKPGDILWTSVGCVHTFANVGDEPVIWIETMAPQPPAENAFRFLADFEKRADELNA